MTPKPTRGGKRKGAGRKPRNTVSWTVSTTKATRRLILDIAKAKTYASPHVVTPGMVIDEKFNLQPAQP